MVVVCESEWEKPGKPRSFFRQIHLPFFRQNAAAWLDRHRTSITYARTVGSGAASSLLLGSLLAGEAYRRMPHRAPAARERALCGACFVVSRALAGLGDSGGGGGVVLCRARRGYDRLYRSSSVWESLRFSPPKRDVVRGLDETRLTYFRGMCVTNTWIHDGGSHLSMTHIVVIVSVVRLEGQLRHGIELIKMRSCDCAVDSLT